MDATFLYTMARQGSVIYPREAVETLKSQPIGTGPFTVSDWVRGDRIVLAKNKDYWVKGLPKLDRVIYRFIPDPNSALAALKAGDVDVSAFGIGPESVDELKKDARFQVIVGDTTNDVTLSMNNSKKPYSDKRVRLAITHAINKDEVLKGAMFGYGKILGSNVDPTNPYFVDVSKRVRLRPGEGQEAPRRGRLPERLRGGLQGGAAVLLHGALRRGHRRASSPRSASAPSIQQIEWGQWLSQVFCLAPCQNPDYDMSIIGHAEAWDIGNFANPKYYFRWDSAEFQKLFQDSQVDGGRQEAPRDLREDAGDAGRRGARRSGSTCTRGWWSPRRASPASGRTCRCPCSTSPRSPGRSSRRHPECGGTSPGGVGRARGHPLLRLAARLRGGAGAARRPRPHHPGPRGQRGGGGAGPARRWGSTGRWPVQYVEWVGRALRGDLGRSIQYDLPVAALILSRLTVTLPLTLLAAGLMIAAAIPLGVFAATRHRRWGDYLDHDPVPARGRGARRSGPGLLLILFFSVQLGWVQSGGFDGWGAGRSGPRCARCCCPRSALGLFQFAVLARTTRSAVLEVLREEYVKTARAKGVAERRVLFRHALRNALIPIVTVAGVQLGQLLAGSIILESVFYLPGLGRLTLAAISARDLPVVQGVVLFVASMIVMVNVGGGHSLRPPRPPHPLWLTRRSRPRRGT